MGILGFRSGMLFLLFWLGLGFTEGELDLCRDSFGISVFISLGAFYDVSTVGTKFLLELAVWYYVHLLSFPFQALVLVEFSYSRG